MNIWLTADLHLDHPAILEHTGRDFNSIDEMNNAFIDAINKYVKRQDRLIIAGDVFWKRAGHFRQRLNVKELWVTQGNHDKNSLKKHVSRLEYMIFLRACSQDFHICHYPLESWRKKEHGSIHLHGHCHNRLLRIANRVDVGMDAAFDYFGEYRPINIEELL